MKRREGERREEEKKRGREEEEERKRKKGSSRKAKVWKLFVYGILVWNGMELMFRSVVSWYKMSFMVYFEFSLGWFWFGRKFPNLAIYAFSPTPLHLGVGVHA